MPSLGGAAALNTPIDYSFVDKIIEQKQRQASLREKQWKEQQRRIEEQDKEGLGEYAKIRTQGIDRHWEDGIRSEGQDLLRYMKDAKSKNPYNWAYDSELQRKLNDYKFNVQQAQESTKLLLNEAQSGQVGWKQGNLEPTDAYNKWIGKEEDWAKEQFLSTGQHYTYVPGSLFKQKEKPIDQFKLEQEALKSVPSEQEFSKPKNIGEGQIQVDKYTTRKEKDLADAARIAYEQTPQLQKKYPTLEDYQQNFVSRHKRVKGESELRALPQAEVTKPEVEITTGIGEQLTPVQQKVYADYLKKVSKSNEEAGTNLPPLTPDEFRQQQGVNVKISKQVVLPSTEKKTTFKSLTGNRIDGIASSIVSYANGEKGIVVTREKESSIKARYDKDGNIIPGQQAVYEEVVVPLEENRNILVSDPKLTRAIREKAPEFLRNTAAVSEKSDKVRVKKDGKTGTIPRSQLNSALRAGYEIIE